MTSTSPMVGSWVVLAIAAMCCYGTCNFLVGAVGELATDPGNAGISCMFLNWCVAGLCGLLGLAKNCFKLPGLDRKAAMYTVCASIFCALGTLVLALALASDPASAGPITAVLPCNSLLVGLLAWIVLREKLTGVHFLGIMIAIAGPICMTMADSNSSSLDGVLLGVVASACFGASNFLLKMARAHGADSTSVALVITVSMGVYGLGSLIGSYAAGRGLKGLEEPKLIVFAMASGACWATAKPLFQLALAGLAGPVAAIVNVNCLVVLVLDLIVFHPNIQVLKYVGMALCIVGVVVLSLAPPPKVARSVNNCQLPETENLA